MATMNKFHLFYTIFLQFIAKKIKTKSLASSKIRKSKRISGDELAFVMTQTGGRPDFLYADSFRFIF